MSRVRSAKRGTPRGVRIGSELGRMATTKEAWSGPHLLAKGLCFSSVLGGEQHASSLYSLNVCLLMSLWDYTQDRSQGFQSPSIRGAYIAQDTSKPFPCREKSCTLVGKIPLIRSMSSEWLAKKSSLPHLWRRHHRGVKIPSLKVQREQDSSALGVCAGPVGNPLLLTSAGKHIGETALHL